MLFSSYTRVCVTLRVCVRDSVNIQISPPSSSVLIRLSLVSIHRRNVLLLVMLNLANLMDDETLTPLILLAGGGRGGGAGVVLREGGD